MASYFLDTSALVKHYHTEHGTDKVDALLAQAGSSHYISRLIVTEFHSVFALKVREQAISNQACDNLIRLFLTDVSKDRYTVLTIGEADFSEAERLLQAYGRRQRVRTLDALQLATARAAKQLGVTTFVT